MAKTKDKKRLPKQVAGIKIPKELRKSAGALLMMAQAPVVREAIATGLIAAATALTGSQSGRRTAKKMKDEAGEAADKGMDQINQTTQAIGAAVVAAMDQWFGRVPRH